MALPLVSSRVHLSHRYRFGDSQYPHSITFAVVNWIDALSRPLYKDIVIDSLKYCQKEKGLLINGWIIMIRFASLSTANLTINWHSSASFFILKQILNGLF
jgi:hypothetical protein